LIGREFRRKPGLVLFDLSVRQPHVNFNQDATAAVVCLCFGAVAREFLRLLGGGCQLPLGVRARNQGDDFCCEAIYFDRNEKPKTGMISGAFQTPGEAASALLEKIYETAK